jgi:hypothetical protein
VRLGRGEDIETGGILRGIGCGNIMRLLGVQVRSNRFKVEMYNYTIKSKWFLEFKHLSRYVKFEALR